MHGCRNGRPLNMLVSRGEKRLLAASRPKLLEMLLLLALLTAPFAWTEAHAQIHDSARPITVWLIPSEEAEARATANASTVAEEIKAFNRLLEEGGGRVRVMNTLPPWDAQLIVFNREFAVPNWAWVKNQTETIRALNRFATANDVSINVRFVTWDRAFGDLNLPRLRDANSPPPDVVQIGSTWAAFFGSRGLIVSRQGYQNRRGAWEDVLDRPACVLPYINDVRLLFSWLRMPLEDKDGPIVMLNTSSWPALLESLRSQGGPEDRIAFAGGLTLNLFWDYAMIVWSGGADPIVRSWWGMHANLTSPGALRTSELLARAAQGSDGRRLIVVPESSHQELTQAFVEGEYRATIEPANFVSRWKKDFDKTYGGGKRFWDYAVASAPPATFHGGSYLAVMPSPDLPAKAFDLAEFLATDEAYTRVLAQNGHMPSQRPGYGMDVLLASLGGSDTREAGRFTEAVQQATLKGRRLPDMPDWPTQVESTDTLENFQRIWRRIGDGNVDGLRREAAAAEGALNLKINKLAQLQAIAIRFWWVVAVVGAVVLFVIAKALFETRKALRREKSALLQTREALRREEAAFEQVRTLRGFSANALLALARYHTLGIYNEVSDGPSDAKKRSIIAAGIQGWRRGRDPANWKPARLVDVVWRSVLLAFDLVHEPDIFEQWEQRFPQRSPREFLEDRGHLRRSPMCDADDGHRSYFVHVTGAGECAVAMPFLLEQALACLFQNAIQASDKECGQRGSRKPIVVTLAASCITVVNAGEPIPEAIRRLVNDAHKCEDFDAAVLAAVRTAGGNRPGIGLAEAYAIATQCYGGISIGEDAPTATIWLENQGRQRP